jgi:hypothetical protein
MEAEAGQLATELAGHGAELRRAGPGVEAPPAPAFGLAEAPPLTAGRAEWLSRAPFAASALLLGNPVYAVAVLVGLLFDRQRVLRRGRREQLSRQVAETVGQARSELSVVVHHAVLAAQSVLTDAFEDAVRRRQDELRDEIAVLDQQAVSSAQERERRAAQAATRGAALDELGESLEAVRRAALGALRAGARAEEPVP